MTWTVYAIEVDGILEYIGITSQPVMRRRHHGATTFWGVPFAMRSLHSGLTKRGALRLEKTEVLGRKPRRNIQHQARGNIALVDTFRWNGSGRWLPVRFRMREGVMHPDRARKIWHRGSRRLNGEVIKRMPGWTVHRAIQMFGSRHDERCKKYPEEKDTKAALAAIVSPNGRKFTRFRARREFGNRT